MSILLLIFFSIYVFYLGVVLLFFSNKLVVWIYDFVRVMDCFRFYKIVFIFKLLKLMSNYQLRYVEMK